MIKNKKEAGEKRGNQMKVFGLVIILIGLMIILMNVVSAVTNITNCQTLSSAGETYTLNVSISNNTITTDCINITAQNITLNCQGYSISSTQNYSGVYSNQLNTTVKNCNISMGSGGNTEAIGIEYVSGSSYGNVFNNTISGDSIGMSIRANNISISNNTINVNSSYGIFVNGVDSQNHTISNNIVSSVSNAAIYVYNNAQYNRLMNNTATSQNGASAVGILVATGAHNNILINNTASINSSTTYGAIHIATNYNTLTSNTGTSNSSSGIRLDSSSNNNLTSNTGTSVSGTGFYLDSSSNNALKNNIANSTNSYGMYLRGAYNSINDSTFTSNSSTAIYMQYGDTNNNIFTNNSIISNYDNGINLDGAPNNTFISNNITTYSTSSSTYGIVSSSNYNNFTFNIITTNASYGIYLNTVSDNTLAFNNFTTVSGTGIYPRISYNNLFRNNIVNTISGNGIYLKSGSYNNNITNNIFASTSGYGIFIEDSYNNNLTNNNASSNSSYAMSLESAGSPGSYGNIISNQNSTSYFGTSILLQRGASHNIFRDCVDTYGKSGDVVLSSYLTNSINNTFINCSYRTTGTNESVAAGSSLIRKWYYRSYVNDSVFGFGLNNSNVLAGIEMPNNQQVIPEINMTGNVLLMHFNNESSGGENSTLVRDWSGMGNNGTVSGAVMNMTGGKHRGAGVFDGVDDWVNVSATSTLSFTTNFSISGWIKSNGFNCPANYCTIIGKRNSVNSPDYEFGINNKNRFFWGGGGNNWDFTTTTTFSDNIWYHIVVVRNGSSISSGTATFYINGIIFDSVSAPVLNVTKDVFVGVDGPDGASDGSFFNGTIDEVAIWNRSLSASEITALYNAQARYFNLTTNATGYTNQTEITEYYNNGGTRIYYNNYTISSSLTGYATASRGYNVSAQSGFNNLNDVFSLTENIFPLWNFLSPTQANNTFINATSTQINISFVEANLNEIKYNWNGTNFTLYNDSLVLMMNFDNLSAIGENSTYVVDVSKYGNNGTVNGGAVWNSSGKYGGAMQFDGVNDLVNVTSSASLNMSGKLGFSVFSWVWTNASTDTLQESIIYGGPIEMFGSSNLGDNIRILLKNSTESSGAEYRVSNVDRNVWSHLGLTFIESTGNLTVYKNGVIVGSVIRQAGEGLSSNITYRIGFNIPNNRYWNGSIDAVQIWNRSLSASEVYQLYASNLYKYNSTQWYLYVNQSKNATTGLTDGRYTYFASAKDSAGNENLTDIRTLTIDTTAPSASLINPANNSYVNNGTSVNFTANVSDNLGIKNATLTITALTNATNWLEFDGVDDYVDVSDNSSLAIVDNMTLSLWVFKKTDVQGSLISKGASGFGGQLAWDFWIDNTLKFESTVQLTSTNSISLNQWQHVVVSMNSSNISFYINGVGETKGDVGLVDFSRSINIGRFRRGDTFFNGSIDEVRIYNRSLSASEISGIYNSGRIANSSINNSGLVAWYDFESDNSNLTRLIDKAAGVNNGTIYNATWNYIRTTSFAENVLTTTIGIVVNLVDGVYKWFYKIFDWAGNSFTTGNFTITVDTVYPTVTVVSPLNNSYYNISNVLFNITSSETANANGSIIPNLDNSLVSWWRMDDLNSSGGIVDYMGRNNGTNVSVTQVTNGKFGRAMGFDGVDDWVNGGNGSSIANITTSITLVAWIKPVGISTSQDSNIIRKDPNYLFSFEKGANKLDCLMGQSWSWHGGTGATFNLDEWSHIVCSYNGSLIQIYKNGILDRSFTTTGLIPTGGENLRIGHSMVAQEGSNYFNGSIDEVMIFNRSLTASEVLGLYNATRISHTSINLSEGNHTLNTYVQDFAGNINQSGLISFTVDTTNPNLTLISPVNNRYLNNGTSVNFTANVSDTNLANATLSVMDMSGNNWMGFDGVDDYVSGSIITQNIANFTSMAWINIYGYSNYGGFIELYDGNTQRSLCRLSGSNNNIGFYVPGGANLETNVVSSNAWHHVVCGYNGTTQYIFIDGILSVSSSVSFGPFQINNYEIGRNEKSNLYMFNGSLDEVRIYNRSLSLSEILQIYNSGLKRNSSINSSGLVAWYDFEPTANLSRLVDVGTGINNGTVVGANYTSTYTSTVYFTGIIQTTIGIVFNLIDGIYNWFYKLWDKAANLVTSSNFTVTVDTTYPQISFNPSTPANNSIKKDVAINVSVSDANNVSTFIDWNNSLVLWMRMDDVNASGDP